MTWIGRGLALCLLVSACTGAGTTVQVVTLEVVLADDWADTGAVIDVVRAFESDHPEVTINLVARPFNQIMDEAQAASDRGQPLDLFHGHAFAAGAIGLAEDLDDRWSDGTFVAADHFPGAVEDVTWGRTRYGIPLDVNALFQVIDASLPTAPRTFEDVRRIAADAVLDGRRGLTLSSNSWEAYGWVVASGGELVEVADDGTPTFLLDSEPVVATLSFLGDMVADGLAYGPLSRDVSSDAYELFAAGDTSLLTTGTWNVSRLLREDPDRLHQTAPMPRGQEASGTVLGGSSLIVGRASAHKDLAVALALALTADEVAVRLAFEEGRFPPRPSLYPRLEAAPGADTLRVQLEVAQPMKLIAFPAADVAFADALEQILTGRADAADALANAQRVAERSVAGS